MAHRGVWKTPSVTEPGALPDPDQSNIVRHDNAQSRPALSLAHVQDANVISNTQEADKGGRTIIC